MADFLHSDLGYVSADSVVVVDLGTAANVRLLDSSNFRRYRSGEKHSFYGGYFKKKPVKLAVPESGHWHVVVDLGGYGGRVEASVRVLESS